MADDMLINFAVDDNFRHKRTLRLRKSRRIRQNPLRGLSDAEVKERYRLLPRTIRKLERELRPQIAYKSRKSFATSSLLQLLTALRFLAGGCFYHIVANTLHVGKATVCRSVKRVVRALCNIGPRHIKLPSRTAAVRVKNRFKDVAGIPNVICCVDGTFIRIKHPTRNTHEYICRKHFPAINAMVTMNNYL